MSKISRKQAFTVLIFLILVLLSMIIRCFTISGIFPKNFGQVRNLIHICLLVVWGISVQNRIIHKQVRHFMLLIVAMIALWIILKAVNYSIDNLNIKHYLWYLYYISILFIPPFIFFVSLSLGKAEDYKFPRWTKILYIPSTVLLILVLTNDFHQTVFAFPSDVMTVSNYKHNFGYYIILVWVILCALGSLTVMLLKCRVLSKKTVIALPIVPFCLSFVYTVLYINGVSWVLLLAGDMTVVHCLLISVALEECIQCGLIQSNMGYNELFSSTTLPVQIIDANFSPKYISCAMKKSLMQSQTNRMAADTVRLDENTLLKRYKLHKGYIVWKEDITEINRLNNELELTREELRNTGNILEAENEQRRKILRLSEENRLYDMIELQTEQQVLTLRNLLNEIQKTDDYDTAKKLLSQVIIIGTYIKRRSNLIFSGEKNGIISVQELRLCLNESVENLNLYGEKCRAIVKGDGSLTTRQATEIYDLFESVVESEIETLKSMLISIDVGKQIEVNICICGDTPLDLPGNKFHAAEWTQDDDGLQYITLNIKNEGMKAFESC